MRKIILQLKGGKGMGKSLLQMNLERLMPKGRAMILAYDQGLEHGPRDFKENLRSVDPAEIIKIAKEGGFTGFVVHRGIAEKYKREIINSEVPLVLKLNGKSELYAHDDPYAPQLYSVEDALRLGAAAVGYTVYSGSKYEHKMNKEFSGIISEAHRAGVAAIGWMYPRGKCVEKDTDPKIVAYAARIGLELGADIVKIKYTGDAESFRWAAACAGPTKVVMSGGSTTEREEEFLMRVTEVMRAGAAGIAVGRNVWQRTDSFGISRKLKEIIFK